MKKMLLNTTLGAVAIMALLSCQSKKQETPSNDESVEIAKDANDSTFDDRGEEKDADFVVNVVTSNLAEIKIAQLAKNKSGNADIQAMATKLEEQHMKLLNELKAYADKRGIAIPLQETDKDAREMEKLSQETPEKFDKQWCESMEDRHEKSISKFESRLNKTDDQELKQWITATLPGLKEHLSMLEHHEKMRDGQ